MPGRRASFLRMTRTVLLLAILVASGAPGGVSGDDYAPGEKLTLLHCGRCHVVSMRNRFGGIGSTPSFAAMRTADDWEERFRAFYALNPHPAFTQVAGVTPPFVPERPSPIHPVELTPDEIETIIQFTRTIEPKDLGAEVR